MRSTDPGRRRGRTVVHARGRTAPPRSTAWREHWQIITAVLLLIVGTIGLAVTDHRPLSSDCRLPSGARTDTREIPADLLPDLRAASRESGVPVRVLAAQLETESHWRSTAESHAGAIGIAQFTQDTWDIWGEGDPYDEHDAIAAQGRYMGHLRSELSHLASSEQELTRFALAGYNAGPRAVTKHGGIPPYPETQRYVTKVMDLANGKYLRSC